MSWWKKIINQLKVEDEEKSVIARKEFIPKEKMVEKELKARVSYQYPQNTTNYLPDRMEKVQRKERKRSWEQVEQQPIEEKEEVKKKEKQVEVIVKKEEKSYFKKPFYRTEVPSPIYGFKKDEQKIEDIVPEYELPKVVSRNIGSFNEIKNEYISYDVEENIIGVHKEKSLFYEDLAEQENSSGKASIEESDDLSPADQEAEVLVEVEAEQKHEDETYQHESINLVDVEKTVDQATLMQEEKDTLEQTIVVRSEQIDDVEVNSDTTKKSTQHAEDETVVQGETQLQLMEQSKQEIASSIEVEKKVERTEQPVTNKENKKQWVPFNVIMLEKDRKNMQKQSMESHRHNGFQKPNVTLLNIPPQFSNDDENWVQEQKHLLNQTLQHFRVGAKVVRATKGPAVTQFEVQPEPGVKVNKVTNLSDDIKLSLSARDIRIEAPIPGKNTIGIEVPNNVSKPVVIREIIRQKEFMQHSSPLAVALGLDIAAQPVVLDLMKMPHGLIAGATGSGKSVCVNSIIVSLLFKSNPEEVKLLLIDPKMVELTPYNHIPHLVSPVITDVKAATAALKWAVEEMERRYELFVHAQVRDISRFNEKAVQHNQEKLPYLVIIIDELADLMMMAPSDVEDAICRIAQKARACGIHLLIATQRPSVDVITGLIKANIPTRIAFSVSSQVDSRTIIDVSGAERLLGKGDMLFLQNGAPKPIRVQGNFVSDEEIEKVVSHVKAQREPDYLFEQEELLKDQDDLTDEDELFWEACRFVIEQDGASTSSLQRRFRIGYNRAARLIDMMENQGIISGSRGSKPRDVLLTETELQNIQSTQ
ncbi:DNA translocase FtsK [Sutcliffiella cohnii]|uniref:DNA translocase FtsK n=1 Tax=Sutcliffiella cohnii TaxID=33932 RepID=UPI002E1D2806|nr:DNA translocase FtsK [Sutcliffiella cohnii]